MEPHPSLIAERDARRLALCLADVGGEGEPIAGGWMACDQPGSWANYAAGLGVTGPLSGDDGDHLVEYYHSRGQTARVEVTLYQHSSVLEVLGERGFSLQSSQITLVHTLDGAPDAIGGPKLSFVMVDPTDTEQVEIFLETHLRGFYPHGDEPGGARPIVERVVQHSRVTLWLLEQEGQWVGSGGFEVFENTGVLIAASVLEPFRCRGIQSAFVRQRLRHARELDLDYVVVGSVPNGPTERNALRAGFRPSHSQLSLCRSVPDVGSDGGKS